MPGTTVIIEDAAAAAVALDPVRARLLRALREPGTATTLAAALGLTRQKVNYHLHALEAHGLVELVEERRKGNCLERVVRATARAFIISPEALGALGPSAETAADRLSSAYLIATAGRAIRDVAALEDRARKEGKRVATLTLDADVRFASAETRAKFADELAGALARIAARYHDDRAPGGRRFRLIAAVHPVPPESP